MQTFKTGDRVKVITEDLTCFGAEGIVSGGNSNTPQVRWDSLEAFGKYASESLIRCRF